MKILHVVPTFLPALRWGGPVHAAAELSQEQARQGHEVTVFTTNNDIDGVIDVPLGQPVKMDGITVWYWPVGRPMRLTFSAAMSRGLSRQIQNFDIVHIHSVFNWPAMIAAFWARRRNVPYIVRPAGSFDPIALGKTYESLRRSVGSRIKKWLYLQTLGRPELNHAGAIHFTSIAEREAASGLALHAPAIVVPLGVPQRQQPITSPFGILRAKFAKLDNRRIILFLSRLDKVKGIDILLAALRILSGQRDDFALVVVGDGPKVYRDEIKTLVQRSDMSSRTLFLGPIFGEQKWAILSEADVFALISHHENFGIAVAEALSAGVPVVISNRINIHREVAGANAGIVTGLKAEEVALAIGRLLDDEPLRRTMGQNGRRLAAESFSWPRAAQHLTQLYTEIVDRSLLVT